MPLFNMYVMVDWSGSDRRRGGRPDCIWIAHGSAEAAAPITVSPASRTEAERIIHAEIQSVVTRNKGRALLCADFGYGYPTGFASLLPHSCFAELPAWRIVWQYLRKHIQDDIGTKPGQQPNNHSNRFAVANEINAQVSSPASRGPFWCLFKPGKNTCVPQNKPRQPFVSQSIAIAALESLTEERYAVPSIRHRQRRQPGPHRHSAPRKSPLRSTVLSMLRRLAFRNRMGSGGRNLARSGAPSPPRRNLSERPSATSGHDQGSWPGARDVALGARSRRNELARQGIRNTSGHNEWIS